MNGIRIASFSDRAAIEVIVQDVYGVYVPRLGRKPKPMLDDYAVLIRDKMVHVFEKDGIIHGIVVLIPEENTILIDNIAVSPSAQGQGYGRKLLEFAEQFARAAGHDSTRLYTNEAMIENIALYSRIGFVETHRAEENGLRRVYMIRALKGS